MAVQNEMKVQTIIIVITQNIECTREQSGLNISFLTFYIRSINQITLKYNLLCEPNKKFY